MPSKLVASDSCQQGGAYQAQYISTRLTPRLSNWSCCIWGVWIKRSPAVCAGASLALPSSFYDHLQPICYSKANLYLILVL